MIFLDVVLCHTSGARESQLESLDRQSADLQRFSVIVEERQTKKDGLTGSKSRRAEADSSRSHRWQTEPRPLWSRLSWRLSRLAQAKGRHLTRQQLKHWARGRQYIKLAGVL